MPSGWSADVRRAALIAVALVAFVTVPVPARAAASATVSVRANAFEPFEASVDRGGVVTWTIEEGGHTIAADDGRFRFRGEGGSALAAGSTVSYTTEDVDEVVRYYCEIHGGVGGVGMAGRLRVGDPKHPAPEDPTVVRVPADVPTLAVALEVAEVGTRIVLAGGKHLVDEPVAVATDGVEIIGEDGAELVPLASTRGFPSAALHITSDRTRVENLAIGSFRTSAVSIDGAESTELIDLAIDGGGFTQRGVDVTAANGVTLRGVQIHDVRGAAINVSGCAACGVLIDEVITSANDIGVAVIAAAGVVVRDSQLHGNRLGVEARADRTAAPLRAPVVTVSGTSVSENAAAGIYLGGPVDTLISGNEILDNGSDVVIAGDLARRTLVTSNVVRTIAWDGLGIDVTFSDNKQPDGARAEPLIDPLAAARVS